jgi:NDP-sugar pyrophosphorylase family protein
LSQDGTVLGTLTDGDIRRAILDGASLSDYATIAMNSNPITARVDDADLVLKKLLRVNNIRSVLLLDSKNRFVKTYSEPQLINSELETTHVVDETFSFAVIMAGGEGERLRPITNTIPKPMIDINGTPLLERQIKNLRDKIGITKVYISVNYLSDVIQDYFGDGKRWGIEIHYLSEHKKLGTAGALSLVVGMKRSVNFLVLNGDILTTSNLLNLYHFHKKHKSQVTIGATNHHIRIPYGVISHEGNKVLELKEKPIQSYFCNAGIYALSSDILKYIPKDTFFNMTDLIDKCLSSSDIVSVFPVHEYWSDIGTASDLEKARKKAKKLDL